MYRKRRKSKRVLTNKLLNKLEVDQIARLEFMLLHEKNQQNLKISPGLLFRIVQLMRSLEAKESYFACVDTISIVFSFQ